MADITPQSIRNRKSVSGSLPRFPHLLQAPLLPQLQSLTSSPATPSSAPASLLTSSSQPHTPLRPQSLQLHFTSPSSTSSPSPASSASSSSTSSASGSGSTKGNGSGSGSGSGSGPSGSAPPPSSPLHKRSASGGTAPGGGGESGGVSPAHLPSAKFTVLLDVEKLTSEERMSRMLHNPLRKSSFGEDSPLVDHFLIVGNKPRDHNSGPQILFQYPLDKPVNVVGLPQFCFPNGIPQRRKRLNPMTTQYSELAESHHDPEKAFVFLITESNASQRYGICVFKEWVADRLPASSFAIEPLCFCFITSIPFLNFHLQVLSGLLDFENVSKLALLTDAVIVNLLQTLENQNSPSTGTRARSYSVSSGDSDLMVILKTMQSYITLKAPSVTKNLVVWIPTIPKPLSFTRPQADEEESLFAEYGSVSLFCTFDVPTILKIISALLLEIKVIFTSSSVRLLSALVFSCLSLLRPFSYHSTVIPVLPELLLPFLEAPVPILAGLSSSFVDKLPLQDSGDILFVNTKTKELKTRGKLLDIPRFSQLKQTLEASLSTMPRIRMESSEGGAAEVPWNENMDFAVKAFTAHFTDMFHNFSKYCISEVTSKSSISIFLKDSFVEGEGARDGGGDSGVAWMTAFCDTQIFKTFEDKSLRALDVEKNIDLRKSTSSIPSSPGTASHTPKTPASASTTTPQSPPITTAVQPSSGITAIPLSSSTTTTTAPQSPSSG
ncbi:DeoxyUTP pyrophosphatase, dUTPase subfamily [Pelomyxa schiedti]|nr:DeoxyUTP pyrophosphatase, dUTPase subfamily [Pelomyxa schiedti]